MKLNNITSNSMSQGGSVAEIKGCSELNDHENTIYQHLWDTAKKIIERKFTVLKFTLEKGKILKIKVIHQKHRKRRKSKIEQKKEMVKI